MTDSSAADGANAPRTRAATGPRATDTVTVAAVVVAYRPERSAFERLLSLLSPQVAFTVVVDNSEDEAVRALISGAAHAAGAECIAIGRNSGIGHAHNVGVARAIERGATLALLSDDDSAPAPDMVERLLAGLDRARAIAGGERARAGVGREPAGMAGDATGDTTARARVAAVGPRVFDGREPASTLVFADKTFGPRRAPVAAGDTRPVPAAFLVASGCLVDLDAWRAIGPMRADLFIDHVDLEWGLRARGAGYGLYVIGDAALEHRLGERVVRPWFLAGRRIHVHSPARNYFLARNTLLLMRGRLMPARWKAGYLVWLAKYAGFNILCVAPRLRRAAMFARALRDAAAARSGPLPAQARRDR